MKEKEENLHDLMNEAPRCGHEARLAHVGRRSWPGYYTILYYVLYYTILYYTLQYCIPLCYTILCCISMRQSQP